MNLLFLAPAASRKRAVAVETRRAVEDGHRVVLIAEAGIRRQGWEDLDPRVEVDWLDANTLSATESPALAVLARRLPLGLLRRLGRGPLRRPADKVARRWERWVVQPLDRRLRAGTTALREARQLERIRARLEYETPDWLVVCEPKALELGIEFLPALLAERPGTITTYAYEPARGGDDAR
ncbi:hypothetical protein [Glycomyces algeriensis]|uniref:Uncharacterized protein n=1 Tax=Glycomyces algeriensis TaxID=256037 RepID=A0A9W6G5Y4_9ACTN|nr:hypothetical protein [Glycomyces algeriensis]MDA1366200.1 hypothetical protein [Glycomyces algeriensis]MDR7349032.1 hypothetical protein [Glycomyces algeriensis]GLI41735.1 hypothetical protein GALLR39Z86_15850 [Glycomyces algeriensis]